VTEQELTGLFSEFEAIVWYFIRRYDVA